MTTKSINLSFPNVDFPIGTTYTKPESLLAYNMINFSIIADCAMTLEIQFSSHSDKTFLTNYKYTMQANETIYDNVSVYGKLCRFKLVNDSDPQTIQKISCETILFNEMRGQLINQRNSIKKHHTASLIRDISDFKIDVINDEYENIFVRDITGHAERLQNNLKRNFWNINSNENPFSPTPLAISVFSSSSLDDLSSLGNGARTIEIEYISLNNGVYSRNNHYIAMNGTNRMGAGISAVAITKAKVIDAGANLTNMGDITIEGDLGGGVYKKMNFIPDGMSEQKFFFAMPITNENLIVNEISYGGTGQFIAFIRIVKVNIQTGIRSVLLKEIVDLNNHYSKIDCSIKIVGGFEFLIGEIHPFSNPPNQDNFFYLTGKGYFKNMLDAV